MCRIDQLPGCEKSKCAASILESPEYASYAPSYKICCQIDPTAAVNGVMRELFKMIGEGQAAIVDRSLNR